MCLNFVCAKKSLTIEAGGKGGAGVVGGRASSEYNSMKHEYNIVLCWPIIQH